jgi:hypothetical protein
MPKKRGAASAVTFDSLTAGSDVVMRSSPFSRNSKGTADPSSPGPDEAPRDDRAAAGTVIVSVTESQPRAGSSVTRRE